MKCLLVIVLIIGGHCCLANLCDRTYDDPCISSSSNTGDFISSVCVIVSLMV